MNSNLGELIRILKGLRAAVGYHELQMPQHAMRCLHALPLASISAFEPVAEILRRGIIKNKADAASIVEALREAACSVPSPVKDAFNLALVVCYGNSFDRPCLGILEEAPPEIYVKADEKK